jgi:hypothetical protein
MMFEVFMQAPIDLVDKHELLRREPVPPLLNTAPRPLL